MNYQPLFNHLHEKYGLILIETELQEIVDVVLESKQCQHRRQTVNKAGDLVCLDCEKILYKSA